MSTLPVADWQALNEAERAALLSRPAVRAAADTTARVAEIIAEVRRNGDAALKAFTAQLDGAELEDLRVSETEIEAAQANLSSEALHAISVAIANVRRFHAAQLQDTLVVETAPGVVCERHSRPIDAVGLYVPAGSAPLPSTAIMLAVPATLAECPVSILCTPPRADGHADPAVVVAARACGIRDMYKVGGAQAIAAMAYGTETIPKVDKIFGPGNAWVTAAKQAAAADAGGAALDMPAGPSEVMVLADAGADPRAIALDLLSQSEHGPDSQSVLVCTDPAVAQAAQAEIDIALPDLPRREIIEKALANGAIIQVADWEQGFEVVNRYAPEHLIIQLNNARQYIDNIKNSASVFLGYWTPESVGDYCSGTNHVLPTYGYARNYSGLSVVDFQKQLTFQELSYEGLQELAPTVQALASLEGLDAHAQAVTVRLDTTRSPSR